MAEENDVLVRFGLRVRELRRRKGMSQEALGLECGLEQAYLSDVELGRRNISLRNISNIARTLGVPLTELFNGVDEEAKHQV